MAPAYFFSFAASAGVPVGLALAGPAGGGAACTVGATWAVGATCTMMRARMRRGAAALFWGAVRPAKKFSDFPKVAGRVARDDKGRVGRFGWKAQKASLDDFVLTACAVELGLQVPGHDQPPLPHKPDYKAPGLDLTQDQCNALIKYVGELPAPVELKVEHSKHADYIASGKSLFATVGCATCHAPKLGDVE